ncbi:hypothetical protein V6N13_140056 [Hibiscus sabdariffa]
MDASFGNDDNKPNGSSGIDASVGDELIGVHFGWSDDMVDEDSYEAHEDSGDSNWLVVKKLTTLNLQMLGATLNLQIL